jgi:hypothetical protein
MIADVIWIGFTFGGKGQPTTQPHSPTDGDRR